MIRPTIRRILLWLVIATVISLALAPFVRLMHRQGLPRVLASFVAVLATIIVVFGLLGASISPLVSQTKNLIHNFPGYVEHATQNRQLKAIDNRFHLTAKARDLSRKAPDVIIGGGTGILKTAGNAINAVPTVFII